MYDVILFTDTTDNIVSIPAIGPYKCAHVLRKHGYSCLVVNHLSDFTFKELCDLIDISMNKQTILVGFSNSFIRAIDIDKDPNSPTPALPYLDNNTVFPQGLAFQREIFAYIKSRFPKVKKIVGGCRSSPNVSDRAIDFVTLGYSESSIVNVADHVRHGKSLPKAHKNIWGVTIVDDRLAPDYDFKNEDMMWLDTDVVNHQALPIEIGRGCVFQCKFCSFPLTGKKVLDFVKHGNLIRNELQYNYDKFGITNYQIVDDTFNDHEEKIDMMKQVVDSLTFEPKFWAYTRCDLLATRPHTIEKLRQMGLRAMYCGIESLHSKAAKTIGKGYNTQKQIEILQYIKQTFPDITLHCNFLIGLPHESAEHVFSSAERIMSGEIPIDSWHFNALMIYDIECGQSFNSDIEKNFTKYGYEKLGRYEPNFILWKNQYMTFTEAQQYQNQIMTRSRAHERFKLNSTLAWPLTTFGLELETLIKTSWRDFDFHHVEHVMRPNFAVKYKEKLFELLNQQHSISMPVASKVN